MDSWLHEKKRDDFDLEVQFKDEKWAQRSKPLSQVTRNSVTDDYYGGDFVDTSDQLLQSHDWTALNSYHNSQSPNAMGESSFNIKFYRLWLMVCVVCFVRGTCKSLFWNYMYMYTKQLVNINFRFDSLVNEVTFIKLKQE